MSVDLTPEEQAETARILADLHANGYIDRDRHEDLAPGVRVRHVSHRWPEAFDAGTGNIVAITERNPSPWSQSWHASDVEMVVVFDKPKWDGASRLSQLAQYHVVVVAR